MRNVEKCFTTYYRGCSLFSIALCFISFINPEDLWHPIMSSAFYKKLKLQCLGGIILVIGFCFCFVSLSKGLYLQVIKIGIFYSHIAHIYNKVKKRK